MKGYIMRIENINDILPSLEGREEFTVRDNGEYTYIDYQIVEADTFDDPIRLECRGIKFNEHGFILARPLHKFFNVGEKLQMNELPWDLSYTIMEKLDGSMIHPALINGDVVFMTRAGVTDVSEQAYETFVEDQELFDFCKETLINGYTPIFEYTSPDNRIVLRYNESKMTLLAVRNTITGEYMDLNTFDYRDKVNVVTIGDDITPDSFIASVKSSTEEKEGYVLHFENGLFVKIKTDEYVLKHRVKSNIVNEKNVLALILKRELDDFLPLLDDEDRVYVETYQHMVNVFIKKTCNKVENIYDGLIEEHGEITKEVRKHVALNVVPDLGTVEKPLLFKRIDGVNVKDIIVENLMRYTSTNEKAKELREMMKIKINED